MARHLSFRSGNPALNKNTFKGMTGQRSSGPIIRDNFMTIEGAVNKTAISLFLLIAAGYYSYTSPLTYLWMAGALFGMIAFFVTIFKKELSPITTPIYALCQGLFLGGISLKEKCNIDIVLDYFPKLSQRLNQQAGTLSGGERKMLAISRSLLGKPKLLLLDEPTEGVWVGVIEEISQILQKLSKDLAIILVEQHVKLALDVSNYAYVMDRGRVAMQGDSIKIKDNPKLLKLLAP